MIPGFTNLRRATWVSLATLYSAGFAVCGGVAGWGGLTEPRPVYIAVAMTLLHGTVAMVGLDKAVCRTQFDIANMLMAMFLFRMMIFFAGLWLCGKLTLHAPTFATWFIMLFFGVTGLELLYLHGWNREVESQRDGKSAHASDAARGGKIQS